MAGWGRVVWALVLLVVGALAPPSNVLGGPPDPALPESSAEMPATATPPEPGPTVGFGAGGLQPLVPSRILDTRAGIGVPAGRVGPDATVTLQVTGRGGVPAVGVGAVVLNVTGVAATANSFVTVWPVGAPRPTASNLNVGPGDTVPNLVVVKVGRGGAVAMFNRFGTVDLVADVAGWFPEGSAIEPLVPHRLLDTRGGVGAPERRVGPDGVVELQVTGRSGIPDTGVGAVVLNVTAVNSSANTFVTAWPTGVDRPVASNLNVAAGATVPNLVIVKVGDGGKVSLFNRFGTVDLVADVTGWFPDGTGLNPVVPDRVLDTRGGVGAPERRVGPDGVVELQVTGRGAIPGTGVGAVVLNVTAVNSSANTFVTAWPTGVDRPVASNLNVAAGATVPNLVIVKVGDGGKVSLFNRFGTVDLVADVTGWFPDGATANTTMTPGTATVLAGPGDVAAAGPSAVELTTSADRPTVGGFLVVLAHSAVPTGVSGRVVAIVEHVDGTARVVLERADLHEMFADLTINGSFGPSDPSPLPAPTGVAHDVDCVNAVSATTAPTFALSGFSGEFDFDLSDRYARLLGTGNGSVSWALSVAGAYSCSLPLGSTLLGQIGPMTLLGHLALEFSVSAAIENSSFSGDIPIRIGFVYDRGDVTNLSSVDLDGTAETAGGFSSDVTIGISAAIEATTGGVVGVEGSMTPQFVAHFADHCISLDGEIGLGLAAAVGRWGIEWDFTLAQLTLGPLNLYRDGCDDKMWTGTIDIEYDFSIEDSEGVVRNHESGTGSYVLRPSRPDLPDGSGKYNALVTASGTEHRWQTCSAGDPTIYPAWTQTWSGSSMRRNHVFALFRHDETDPWMFNPHLVFGQPNPLHDDPVESGGVTTTQVDTCPGSSASQTFDDTSSRLGWTAGRSNGAEPLPDTNPDPDRLVGTATWELGSNPSLLHDHRTYTYRVTYDLTRVDAE